ncbi:type VII toxin-antitoxin system HepT family RNase toxin [Desulfosarcina ovata]|uniref:DUF86 domain-containing protein n=1 Tax=Desulfosarcina ovata subsp. ovata TaxID=2752305 RepID=A0A5K8A5E7_9BACT|nr:DUF86 domain-containing protein [Desulfosarcina ovata]BBO87676.1 hypothetical protein DSCOOX_08560 [Desulfosarcina ovata subsp. ovata]
MTSDVLLNKVAIIERCLSRIEEEYRGHEQELDNNYTRQDSIILNLQRACEASIDAAMHLVRVRKLGVPQESRDAFDMLGEADLLKPVLRDRLKSMVGFRNVAVHGYRKLNIEIVRTIVETRLGDFRELAKVVLQEGHE